jgi:hypothetical protein
LPVSSIFHALFFLFFHSFPSFNSNFYFSTFLFYIPSIFPSLCTSFHSVALSRQPAQSNKGCGCVPTHPSPSCPVLPVYIYPNSTTARPELHKGLTPQKYAWDVPGPCCRHNCIRGTRQDTGVKCWEKKIQASFNQFNVLWAHVVSCGCETWSLILWQMHGFSVPEKRVLRNVDLWKMK